MQILLGFLVGLVFFVEASRNFEAKSNNEYQQFDEEMDKLKKSLHFLKNLEIIAVEAVNRDDPETFIMENVKLSLTNKDFGYNSGLFGIEGIEDYDSDVELMELTRFENLDKSRMMKRAGMKDDDFDMNASENVKIDSDGEEEEDLPTATIFKMLPKNRMRRRRLLLGRRPSSVSEEVSSSADEIEGLASFYPGDGDNNESSITKARPQMINPMQKDFDEFEELFERNLKHLKETDPQASMNYLRDMNSVLKVATLAFFYALKGCCDASDSVINSILSVNRSIRKLSQKAIENGSEKSTNKQEECEDDEDLVDLSVRISDSFEYARYKLLRRSFEKLYHPHLSDETETPVIKSLLSAITIVQRYSAELKRIPGEVILRLIHTIYAELDKEMGLIRRALTVDNNRTIAKCKESLNVALLMIYASVQKYFESIGEQDRSDALAQLDPRIFQDILMTFIEFVEFDQENIEEHLKKLTLVMRPWVRYLEADVQLMILEYIIHAEQSFIEVHGGDELKWTTLKLEA